MPPGWSAIETRHAGHIDQRRAARSFHRLRPAIISYPRAWRAGYRIDAEAPSDPQNRPDTRCSHGRSAKTSDTYPSGRDYSPARSSKNHTGPWIPGYTTRSYHLRITRILF